MEQSTIETPAETTETTIEPLHNSLERSRLMGEYYRDMATNYADYHRTQQWPQPPFPPQHWVTTTDLR